MDVLYVVRGDRPELRYSLRSMERNASNVGRVVVAGTDLPGFLIFIKCLMKNMYYIFRILFLVEHIIFILVIFL